MARNTAVSIENNFVNGLITQATGLNFPESAVTDCNNVVFSEIGNVYRRKGFDFEAGFKANSIQDYNKVLNTFLWLNAAGSSRYNFVVVQGGRRLYFYKLEVGKSTSAGRMIGTVDLYNFATGQASPAEQDCQFASGYGRLFVTNPRCDPFYVEYVVDEDDVQGTKIPIRIRDTEGIDEGTQIDSRPSNLTKDHQYNLENQGWTSNKWKSFYDGRDNPRFPSNADVWWIWKDDEDNFSRSQVNKVDRGNSPAPRGHKILGEFSYTRGTEQVSSGGLRPTTVAFYAGRAWYAGTQAQNFSNKVYFSQIIDTMSKAALCYQLNDPTSEISYDLLPSDGGVVVIPEAGTIVKLFSISGSLLVFATNGVWTITGSVGSGFAANDYTVRKISSVPAINSSSFVDINGYPAWWNYDGIYLVSGTDQLGQIQVASLSDKKIKDWYLDIPTNSKKYAKGSYDPVTKIVRWLYSSEAPDTIPERSEFDRILHLNTITQAFYPASVDTSKVKIHGIFSVEGLATKSQVDDVYDENGSIVNSTSLVEVQVESIVTTPQASVCKMFVSYVIGSSRYFTFAEEYSEDYTDWKSFDTIGSTYESYLVTGFKIRGDAVRKFQTNYLYVFCDTEVEQAVYVQALWNFANTGDTGKWSTRQRITLDDTEYDYGYRRLKIRGSGLAVQFKFSSYETEPFNLIGWTGWETGNAQV